MAATAEDYGWIREWRSGLLLNAYCLTFVRATTPDELLDELSVGHREPRRGASEVSVAASAAWDTHQGRGCYVAVTTAGGWSVMFEDNGWIGATPATAIAVSEGTTFVSHYGNVNALDAFTWAEDAALQVSFEPLFPYRREGAKADDIAPVMREVGFDLRDGPERSFDRTTEAAFALGERLTGVRVTGPLLDGSDFICGIAPLPP